MMEKAESSSRRRSSVQSVDRALKILSSVAFSEKPLGVREIARRCGLKPSTAYSLIKTLRASNYIESSQAGRKCKLGVSAILLSVGKAQEFLSMFHDVSYPIIDQFYEEFPGNIGLYALLGDNVFSISNVVAKSPGTYTMREGLFIRDPHQIASGRMLFSMAEPRVVASFCRKCFGRAASEEAVKFKAALASIAVCGYAEGENLGDSGSYAASAPVNGVKGVPLALGVSIPVSQMESDSKTKMKRLLLDYSRKMEIVFKNVFQS